MRTRRSQRDIVSIMHDSFNDELRKEGLRSLVEKKKKRQEKENEMTNVTLPRTLSLVLTHSRTHTCIFVRNYGILTQFVRSARNRYARCCTNC